MKTEKEIDHDRKKYLMDDEPVSAYDIIVAASAISSDFGNDGIKQTSVAAAILRQHGHKIENRPTTCDK